MSYSVSTHNNPFCQGGWQSHITMDQSPIPCPSTPPIIPIAPSSTKFRLAPCSSYSSNIGEHTDYALLNPNNRILYTITSRGPFLTLVKDSHERPTALIESSATPCV